MDTTAKATPEQLKVANDRLKKGEGWIGYRNIGKNPDGTTKYSNFLYVLFYRNGEQVPINTKTNDAEEAYKQLLDARGKTERGILVLPNEAARITYEQLREKYIADKPQRENQGHMKGLDSFFKGVKAVNITSDEIRKYIARRRREKISDPTIRRELVVLRAMFKLALKEKTLSYDQVPYFPMPEDSLPAGEYITPEQFREVLEALPNGEERGSTNGGPKSETNLVPFFTFMYGTGCRLGAAQKITWGMVSEDCSVITLPPGFVKNRQRLTIVLAGAFLEPVKKELQKMFRRESHPVFDSTNFRPEWAKACAKAGIGTWDQKTRTRTGVRIHDCRCSGAINLLESGVDEGTVLKIGGWKTRAMLDRYNVTSVARLTTAMEKAGKYITDRMKVAGSAS
jgi:integrase